MIKFSLLICIYAKESPDFFSKCLDSILAQTAMPNQLIIVKDGPLTEELEAVIRDVKFPGELTIVDLPENVTLGPARAEGVKAARYEWVAVMDSDDICCQDRFEKQIETIESNLDLGLLGGQIAEFDRDQEDIAAIKAVPTACKDIYKFAGKRNPFNSMTVMFRRNLVIEAGNYRYFPMFEDYDLWIRMLKNGVRCVNHPDILVYARVGGGMYGRRRGLPYVKSEWQIQRELKHSGLINGFEFLRNVIVRIPVRLLPEKWLAYIYNKFARGRMS